MYKYG